MKPSKEERDLDERIRSAIGPEEVTFDFNKWKQEHRKQIELFKSTVSQEASVLRKTYLWQMIIQSRVTQIAAAAAIIIATCIFFIHHEQAGDIKTQQITKTEKAPAELLTMMSLNLAYRRGGMEAVDKQYEKAFKRTGSRPVKLTVEDLFVELNGG